VCKESKNIQGFPKKSSIKGFLGRRIKIPGTSKRKPGSTIEGIGKSNYTYTNFRKEQIYLIKLLKNI